MHKILTKTGVHTGRAKQAAGMYDACLQMGHFMMMSAIPSPSSIMMMMMSARLYFQRRWNEEDGPLGISILHSCFPAKPICRLHHA